MSNHVTGGKNTYRKTANRYKSTFGLFGGVSAIKNGNSKYEKIGVNTFIDIILISLEVSGVFLYNSRDAFYERTKRIKLHKGEVL